MAFKVAQAVAAFGFGNDPITVDLFEVPAGKEAVISTLSVSEQDGAPAEFAVLIRPGGASQDPAHVLISAAEILANDTQFFTIGIALAETDVISVRGTTAGVTFMAFVNETEV